MKSLLTLLAAVVVLLSGCESVPLDEKKAEASTISCDSCPRVPKVSYAVTRPMACNDYPVAYRVNSADSLDKVYNINSTNVNIDKTQTRIDMKEKLINNSCGR